MRLFSPDAAGGTVVATFAQLGVDLDYDQTIDPLERDTFVEWAMRKAGRSRESVTIAAPSIKVSDQAANVMAEYLRVIEPEPAAAGATLVDGEVQLRFEVPKYEVDQSGIEDALVRAFFASLDSDDIPEIAIPVIAGKKRISNSELAVTNAVVGEYSTRFSSPNSKRSQNLKRAAEIIDGLVLLPGEEFSFNDRVGRRTIERGFQKAGAYVRGRHGFQIGGGVCQVSTTLYNAALLADLELDKRYCHTFAVPYVPLGRDAAVSYGEVDMSFKNTRDEPIAISAKWEPRLLTFSILGKDDPGLEVKIYQRVTKSWAHPIKYEHDDSLAAGELVEIEKGGKGYQAVTTKVVSRDGEEVSRAVISRSYYRGGSKIVALNKDLTELPGTADESTDDGLE